MGSAPLGPQVAWGLAVRLRVALEIPGIPGWLRRLLGLDTMHED